MPLILEARWLSGCVFHPIGCLAMFTAREAMVTTCRTKEFVYHTYIQSTDVKVTTALFQIYVVYWICNNIHIYYIYWLWSNNIILGDELSLLFPTFTHAIEAKQNQIKTVPFHTFNNVLELTSTTTAQILCIELQSHNFGTIRNSATYWTLRVCTMNHGIGLSIFHLPINHSSLVTYIFVTLTAWKKDM